jgi:hypothetical protein
MRRRLLAAGFFTLVILSAADSFAAKDYMARLPLSPDNEDGAAPVTTEYQIDVDGDGANELVKIIYGPGVSNKHLTIEVRKDGELMSTLEGEFGVQSNYRIEDVDGDGKKEIIIWSGLWDPRLPGEEGVTAYEGHSSPHRYVVATYKLLRSQYTLWDIFTTKNKYEPYCEEMPE